MKKTSLYIDPDVDRALNHRAAAEGITKAELVRRVDLDGPPTVAELEEMAESWRPYRTWVSLYLRTMLEDETGEISHGSRTKESLAEV